ncbi:hypothetical protein IEQ34_016816 [Dendrobium chrysotoxum]|uniref:Uncharacterized protein n=1 Tax=Dendrobium chrysotoxum TaxID=161865 RepID=A0AAV7GHE7_DENCH|nr:hypothetical protein IEQ34_016816 [Dendrobium chrysotoxum]
MPINLPPHHLIIFSFPKIVQFVCAYLCVNPVEEVKIEGSSLLPRLLPSCPPGELKHGFLSFFPFSFERSTIEVSSVFFAIGWGIETLLKRALSARKVGWDLLRD